MTFMISANADQGRSPTQQLHCTSRSEDETSSPIFNWYGNWFPFWPRSGEFQVERPAGVSGQPLKFVWFFSSSGPHPSWFLFADPPPDDCNRGISGINRLLIDDTSHWWFSSTEMDSHDLRLVGRDSNVPFY
ncbi:hypothetical protein CEXT_411391 [Caerostris extrusa]|uniref:Uncharacterized protein n=1 Tax=Caerostris extrusa TaxID=172846 RepID=A0AAV4XCE7_CAEEX|nr:hypothetical protein CEXT_411391 [Caerostris extrusa]